MCDCNDCEEERIKRTRSRECECRQCEKNYRCTEKKERYKRCCEYKCEYCHKCEQYNKCESHHREKRHEKCKEKNEKNEKIIIITIS